MSERTLVLGETVLRAGTPAPDGNPLALARETEVADDRCPDEIAVLLNMEGFVYDEPVDVDDEGAY